MNPNGIIHNLSPDYFTKSYYDGYESMRFISNVNNFKGSKVLYKVYFQFKSQ